MRTTGLLTLLLLATPLAAQNSLPTEEVEARRYTVEMIIFSYAQSVSAGSEIFVADIPRADGPLMSVPDEQDAVNLAEEMKPLPRREVAIERLDRSDFSLGEVYGHLRRLGAYRPLAHFGWTQRTVAGESTVALPLSAFTSPPAGLDGELNLYLNRYLHLDVDLKLAAGQESATGPQPGNAFGESYPVYYRIDEDRIFKNGDLRYFDHPKFGVIAKISRVEEADEPAELASGS